MIRGILFDKDGTLFSFADTWGAWIDRLVAALAPDDDRLQQRLASAIGYDLQKKAFVAGSAAVNATADETIALLADLLPGVSHAQIEEVGLNLVDGLPLAPVTDLPALFSSLKNAGYTLGLATNDYESIAHRHLAELNIKSRFDFICGYDSGYGSKPEPGMINAFCKASALDASEVTMVGDSTHDLIAGRRAGAGLVVGVLTGPAVKRDLIDYADEIIEDISELPDLLNIKT